MNGHQSGFLKGTDIYINTKPLLTHYFIGIFKNIYLSHVPKSYLSYYFNHKIHLNLFLLHVFLFNLYFDQN